MVLSRPIFDELPEIIPSIFPFSLDITCWAFVALTAPDGLAEGAAIGVFARLKNRLSNRVVGHSDSYSLQSS